MDGSENNSLFKRGDLVLMENMELMRRERKRKENKLLGTVLESVDRQGLHPFYRVVCWGFRRRCTGSYIDDVPTRIYLPWERNMEKL
jgi:hypothetical protein